MVWVLSREVRPLAPFWEGVRGACRSLCVAGDHLVPNSGQSSAVSGSTHFSRLRSLSPGPTLDLVEMLPLLSISYNKCCLQINERVSKKMNESYSFLPFPMKWLAITIWDTLLLCKRRSTPPTNSVTFPQSHSDRRKQQLFSAQCSELPLRSQGFSAPFSTPTPPPLLQNRLSRW